MNLTELAWEYRKSGELCRGRVTELRQRMAKVPLTESEKLVLYRRITVLAAMARDTIATSNQLAKYYDGGFER